MTRHQHLKLFTELGFRLFRAETHGKKPLSKGWQEEACLDISKLTNLFANSQNNIAIATGEVSGINVIDIDIKNGKDGRKSIIDRFGLNDSLELPPCLVFKTPNNGLHIPVKWSPDTNVSCGSNVLNLEGVDIRGNNGLIIAPPSTIEVNGVKKQYQIVDPSLPIIEPVGWIKELLTDFKHSKTTGAPFDPTSVMQGLSEGNRNDSLFRYICQLRAFGVDRSLIQGFMFEAAKRCTPPFPQNEMQQVLNSAFSYPSKSKSTSSLTLEDVL